MTAVAEDPAFRVLLVEDNAGDIRLTRETFRSSNPSVTLDVVTNGVEALAFLRQEGMHRRAVRPDLVLLDLNLPRMDGREVLAHIKQDDRLKAIPVLILSTSDAEQDIETSYRLYANCFLRKPVQLEAFQSMIALINDFWLTRVELPRHSLSE